MAFPDTSFKEHARPTTLMMAVHKAQDYILDAANAAADGLSIMEAAHVSAALITMNRKANDIRRILREMA